MRKKIIKLVKKPTVSLRLEHNARPDHIHDYDLDKYRRKSSLKTNSSFYKRRRIDRNLKVSN